MIDSERARRKTARPAHRAARAVRHRAHERAGASSRRAANGTVAAHAPSKKHNASPKPTPKPHMRRHVPDREPAARPKRTVHPHPTAAGTHEAPKPTRKPRIRPHNRANVPLGTAHLRPKTFAWLKVAGAAGYRVAFFKPGGAILFRDTKTPQLTVPGTWRYQGKRETLSPGRYRWYVWPLDARGRPSTRAIVNSALVIGG